MEPNFDVESDERLVGATLDLMASWPVGYGDFFNGLASVIQSSGLPQEPEGLPVFLSFAPLPARETWQEWRNAWWSQMQALEAAASDPRVSVLERLKRWNLNQTPTRSLIETLWESIDQRDHWLPLNEWLDSVMKYS